MDTLHDALLRRFGQHGEQRLCGTLALAHTIIIHRQWGFQMDGKRNSGLDEGVFSYRAQKDGTVRIAYRGRVVTTLAGKEATRFLSRVDGAGEEQAQLAMAKATGNFKRGNERQLGRQ